MDNAPTTSSTGKDTKVSDKQVDNSHKNDVKSENNGENSTTKESRASSNIEPPSEEGTIIRDQLGKLIKSANIPYFDNQKIGQEVLDAANGGARFEEKNVNDTFNHELQEQINGNQEKGHIYKLGKPSKVLKFSGVEDLPIEMAASTLETKSSQEYKSNHPFDLEDVKDLPRAIQFPVAVFDSDTIEGSKVILTELKDKKGKNFVAVLSIRKSKGRNVISLNNSIVSLYPKDSAIRIAKWFDSEKELRTDEPLCKWADTKKASQWLANHVTDVHAVGISTKRIAKVINSFENNQFPEEKIRLQRVFQGSPNDFDEFDNSHMGEGEGMQAHGWGQYVAAQKNVAKGYAETSKKAILYKGNPVSEQIVNGRNTPECTAFMTLQNEGTITKSKKRVEQAREYAVKDDNTELVKYWDSVLNILNNSKKSDFKLVKSRNLYEVEIPDNTGDNYLEENNKLTDTQKKLILEALPVSDLGERIKSRSGINDGTSTGRRLYKSLETELGSSKAASEFLRKAGFNGIHYDGRQDGECYVIFNPKDMKITDHVRFFRTSNGRAYGFTIGGKIYIDPTIAGADTPIHEYSHLWAEAMRKGNPKEWKNIVDLMKGTSVWDEIKKQYPELKTEDDIADEVLAQYSGKRGAEKLREEAKRLASEKGKSIFEKAEAVSALQKIKDALNKFWKNVVSFFHVHFTTAEEVADKVLSDLLNEVNPTRELKKKNKRDENLITHLDSSPSNFDKLSEKQIYEQGLDKNAEKEARRRAILIRDGKRSNLSNSDRGNAANELSDIVKERGYNTTVSHSRKDFGNSDYVTIMDKDYNTIAKVRFSDHDVSNTYRVLNEYHADVNDDMNAIADDLLGKDSSENIEEVNSKFNERLSQLIDGDKGNRRLSLGNTGRILRSAGISNAEIILDYDKVIRKGDINYKHEHPFSPNELFDLPKRINNPIAVFSSATRIGDKVILTELKNDGKNFIVVISAKHETRKGGLLLEINEIKDLYPKEEKGVIKWLNDGLAKYVNKEKALNWLGHSRYHSEPPANEELISAANIVENFENPNVGAENNEQSQKDFEEVNGKFNERLPQLIDGDKGNRRLSLGNTGSILRSSGISNAEIILN